MKCVAVVGRNNEKCGEETELGYKYCDEHKGRNKGVEERARAGISSLSRPDDNVIIDLNGVDEPIDYTDDYDPSALVETKNTKDAKLVLNEVSHKTVVDQVHAGLKRVTDFELICMEAAYDIPRSQWRYRDHKSGSEQIRGEIQLLERAMDRTQRFVQNVVKLGLEAKAQIIEKAQYEGVRAALNRTFVRMGLEKPQIDEALRIFADEIQKLVTPSED